MYYDQYIAHFIPLQPPCIWPKKLLDQVQVRLAVMGGHGFEASGNGCGVADPF
jgi:hypothetical protein